MNLRVWFLLLFVANQSSAFSQTRDEQVRGDREKVTADGFWIYNNLPKAFSEAKSSNKPIIVVLRCIPCHECVKLDDELVDTDPVLRPLLEKFVRARQVSTNGLDLDLFQYDTDQSFAVFLLNADGTIYARFGTRSHRTEWYGDVSIKGLADALQRVLEFHQEYPANKSLFAGKRGEPLEFASPELYPSLKDKFTDQLNYKGNVVKSCIHCHQIGDARRVWYRNQGKPIPEKLLYPYPHPTLLGLTVDPNECGRIKDVSVNSLAAKAGFMPGDQIKTMNGQAILSLADIQWVLHHSDSSSEGKAASSVKCSYERDGSLTNTQILLPKDWRRDGDLSWRVSSWPYRGMVTGGMLLEAAPAQRRNELGVATDKMALLVKRVGKYGSHAAAKKAGLRENDVVVKYDGRDDLMTDSELLAYGVNARQPGESIEVAVVRGTMRLTFRLPIQK